MENTFNNNFSASAEYNNNKPSSQTYFQYLFDRTNPDYLPYWVAKAIYRIHYLSLLKGYTFCSLEYLANLIGKTSRTVRDVLKKLVDLGVLHTRTVRKNKQYYVNWPLLRQKVSTTQGYYSNNTEISAITSAIFDENFPESPFDTANYEDENSPTIRNMYIYKGSDHHENDDLQLSDSLKPSFESDKQESLITLDPVETEIKQRFEAITGKTLNLQKNKTALAELKEIASHTKDVIVLAFRNVANHVAETNTKIYNLGYVVTAAKNLLNKIPKQKNSLSNEVRANSVIGGSHSKYAVVEVSPEQKALELEKRRKHVETELKHEVLKTKFYNDLPEEVKNELIQQELVCLKTEPFWEKIKPKWPWFDEQPAIRCVIERIKDYLLQEHLEYSAFLASEPSG